MKQKKSRNALGAIARLFFAAIFLVSFMLCLLTGSLFARMYRDDMIRTSADRIKLLRENIHSKVMENTEAFSLDFAFSSSLSTELTALMRSNLPGKYSRINLLYKDIVSSSLRYSNIVSSIIIFFPPNNIMLSNRGVKFLDEPGNSPIRDFYEKYRDANHKSNYWIWDADFYTPGQNCLYYACRYPVDAAPQDQMFMLFSVSNDILYDSIENFYFADQNHVYIMDGSKTVLSYPERNGDFTEVFPTVSPDQLSGIGRNDDLHHADGSRHIAFYMGLGVGDLSILHIIPYHYFQRQMLTVYLIVLAIGLVSLAAGLLLSRFFSKLIYKPIRQVYLALKDVVDPVYGEHEFQVINKAILSLNKSKDELIELKEKSTILAKHSLILRLAEQPVTEIKLHEYTQAFELSLPYNHFCFVIIRPVMTPSEAGTASQMMLQQILLHLEAIDLIDGVLYATTNFNEIFVLVNFRQESGGAMAQVIRGLHSQIRDQYRVLLHVAAGYQTGDAGQIIDSFRDARRNMAYSLILSPDTLLSEDNVRKRDQSQEVLPDFHLELQKALNTRNRDLTGHILDHFLETVAQQTVSLDTCKDAMMKITNIVTDFEKQCHFQGEEAGSAYLQASSAESYIRWLQAHLKQIFDHDAARREQKKPDLIDQAKQYIMAHPADDLSLNAVAAQFHLSPKYFSKLFKDETGDNYIDYVTAYKLDMAYKMLLETSKSVEEIGLVYGYQNPAYFIRRFRERFGKTPGSVRNGRRPD